MNKQHLSVCVLSLLLSLTACRKEFDDHYHSEGNSSVGLNIVQVLKEKEELSLFVQMIKRADLERTLGESGLYTCFAPRNKDVESFLQANNATVESLPMQTLMKYINYHFMTGMKFQYDFEKEYENIKPNLKNYEMYFTMMATKQTRDDSKNPSKYIRVFTQPYFNVCAEDYKLLRGKEGSDFMVEGARVSSADRDIPASNGVVHILDEELPLAPRSDEAIAKEADLSILNAWLDGFSGYELSSDAGGVLDSIPVKYYNISKATKGRILDLASETDARIIFAPTDEAIRTYFQPYMTPEMLGTDYTKITKDLLVPILQAMLSSPTTSCWGIGNIARNSSYFFTYSDTEFALENDVQSMFTQSVFSSNAIIYKVNKMPEIPILQSIEGGLYINRSKYEEWYKMLTNGRLWLANVTDNFSYQHPPRTILIQPDSKWDKKVDDYDVKYLDTLGRRLSAGVLNLNVKNGQFQKRYYPGSYGYILYEGDGQFSDFHENKAHLVNPAPVWTKETGNIYEIDHIFDALMPNDTTELMYRKYIKEKADYSYFGKLCEITEVDLDAIGWNYTVFAPTNAAFTRAGYSLARIESMEKDEAKKLIASHLVGNRKIFTDGFTTGSIQSDGVVLHISGSWDTFSISTQNGGGSVVPEMCNKQASNGVFHGITGVLR